MDFYIGLFIFNWVLILLVSWVDTDYFNEYLYLDEETFLGFLYRCWCLVSLISIPALLVYLVTLGS